MTGIKATYAREHGKQHDPDGDCQAELPDGSTAFIFLRGLFPKADARTLYEEVLSKLKFSDARHSRRPGLKGGKGGEMLMGWVNFPFPRPAGPVKHQFELYLHPSEPSGPHRHLLAKQGRADYRKAIRSIIDDGITEQGSAFPVKMRKSQIAGGDLALSFGCTWS